MSSKGVGVGKTIPVILKVAKLSSSLDLGGAVPDTDFADITFDKEVDEVVLIYAADLILENLNGLGTGTEVNCIITRDQNEETLDFDDAETLISWSMAKSFVTSGMAIPVPNFLKNFVHPMITSRPTLRVVGQTTTAVWSSGLAQVHIYYSTRKLDDEARRVLTGGR